MATRRLDGMALPAGRGSQRVRHWGLMPKRGGTGWHVTGWGRGAGSRAAIAFGITGSLLGQLRKRPYHDELARR
jgi:hypothetical protein